MIPAVSGAAAAPAAGTHAAGASAAAATDPQLERATIGFERLLLTELLRPVAESAGESAPPAYREMLPQALAEAVTEGGGIGLAAELRRALAEGAR